MSGRGTEGKNESDLFPQMLMTCSWNYGLWPKQLKDNVAVPPILSGFLTNCNLPLVSHQGANEKGITSGENPGKVS